MSTRTALRSTWERLCDLFRIEAGPDWDMAPRYSAPLDRDIPREAAAFSAACADDSENEPPDFDVDDGFGA